LGFVHALINLHYTEPTALSPKWERKAMQTTLNIDDKLFEEAAKLAATDNQSQLIEIALGEFINNHRQIQKRDVRDLVGKVEIAPDYDYKKLRTGER